MKPPLDNQCEEKKNLICRLSQPVPKEFNKNSATKNSAANRELNAFHILSLKEVRDFTGTKEI